MRIVALHTDFRIYWPARLKALSTALSDRGDSLDVIEIAGKGSPYSFAEGNSNPDLNWHILFPDSKPEELTGKTIEPKLFELLSTIRPDVIIAGAIAFPSGALAVRWGQRYGTRVIIFDDAKIEAVKRNALVNFIKQSVYDGVDAMFYPASDWEETGKFWHFRKEQLFYGVDVVDNDFWAKPVESNTSDRKYFVAVGRQIPKKNFDKIIKAYKQYSVSVTNPIPLQLIGDGPQNEQLKSLVGSLCLDNLISMTPFLPQEELRKVYHDSLALIIASNSDETWGLVINEAMASGCAIIASKQCGATDTLVKDDVNGFTFNCEDVDALSNEMHYFHNLDDKIIQSMREQSKKIVSVWGLDLFTASAIRAIDYVTHNKKAKTFPISKLIIKYWKGQYRPI